MDFKSVDDKTRDYYQRVMDEWREPMAEAHPYDENYYWQRHFATLKQWVADMSLAQGRVLEVGCGTGLLQDVVDDYFGIDIVPSSAQFMHHPFSVASATRLPFADNSFDGVWSVWVLEHVPQPEEMLAEMRRVVKPGGTLFLVAAYAVDSWISQGIHKRPFRDLPPRHWFTRLTAPLRGSIPYKVATTLPVRLFDLLTFLVWRRPTRLRYGRLQPNFETYWDYDADACVSLDSYSVALYFMSRGDRPCYQGGIVRSLLQRSQAQAYVVHK